MNRNERFWAKVNKEGPVHPTLGRCWLWQGFRTDFGHGQVGGDRGTEGAHCAAWREQNGDIPKGQCVLHACDNPSCVNPAHLWLGTRAANSQDMVGKGRHRTRPWKIPECQLDNYHELKGW